MNFLFEQKRYSLDYLKTVLPVDGHGRFVNLPNGFVTRDNKLDGVGYVFTGKDITFVLPKVFLGTSIEQKINDKDVRDMSELSMWVCSSIGQYRLRNPNDKSMEAPDARNFSSSEACPTLIDVKNSMERFYEENRSLFVFVSKNVHSGNNRVDWRRTMRRMPVMQGETPIYMELVNKRKVFDLDDRLIVLYFSAMNYIHEVFGFKMPRSEFYAPMRVNEFRRLLGHRGLMELRRIKHKYFADKFLRLYNIMKAFFEWGGNFRASDFTSEYLLTSKYNNVFEAMIDKLVGDDSPELQKKKHLDDGKIIDHLYKENALIFNSGDPEKIWHIGDSKYYSDPADIRGESIAKQFTYAKNIIQDFFSPDFVDSEEHKDASHQGVHYRDELTEGYSITPNFFIRGEVDSRNPMDVPGVQAAVREIGGSEMLADDGKSVVTVNDYLWEHRNRQFRNRLFDRDTLLLQVYNVNFLYVLKAYTAKSSSMRTEFKREARGKFRDNFLKLLEKKYYFWAVLPNDPDVNKFINDHFRVLVGKVFSTGAVRGETPNYLIMAMERKSVDEPDEDFKKVHDAIVDECRLFLLDANEIWGSAFSQKKSCSKETWLQICP